MLTCLSRGGVIQKNVEEEVDDFMAGVDLDAMDQSDSNDER